MSRPRTPATISDTFSDPGSLSDLESGWTDLSSNRSGGRLRTFSVSGDPSDGEDAFEERFEEETWEGLVHSDTENDGNGLGETVLLVPEATSDCPPSSALPVSDPDTKETPASTFPVLSNGPIDSNSSSQCSIRGSRATLRLSFPDPLSNSRESTLSPHVHAKLQGAAQHVDEGKNDSGDVIETFCENFEGTTAAEVKDSVPTVQDCSSPRFAIILLGYNPLRSLKSSILEFLLNAVATSLEGPPILADDLQLSRTFSIPLRRKPNPVDSDSNRDADLDYIFISDRTTSLDMRPLETLDCPTLVVVFLQPPHRRPSLPNLPTNVKYLPILLHTLGNDSVSSLLDLSPSILFDNTELSITLPGNNLRRQEASQQCQELKISESRIDGAFAEILTAEQLTMSYPEDFSLKLREAFFLENNRTFESDTEKASLLSSKSTCAFVMLLSVIFLMTNVLKPFEAFPPYPNRPTPVQETIHPIHVALKPTNVAKTLGVSVIRYETKSLTSPPITDSTTVCLSHIPSTSARGSPATIESSPPILTLDPPLIKALALVPAKSVIRKLTMNTESMVKTSESLTVRLTSALSPVFDVIHRDLQELLDAVDVFLQAVGELQEQAIRGFCEIVDVIKEQANHGMQHLSTKLSSVAQSLGDLASYRHVKAQNNARRMRVVGERFVSVAKQRFGARWARARGNARNVFRQGVSTGKVVWNLANDGVENKRGARRQGWEGLSKNWRGEYHNM